MEYGELYNSKIQALNRTIGVGFEKIAPDMVTGIANN